MNPFVAEWTSKACNTPSVHSNEPAPAPDWNFRPGSYANYEFVPVIGSECQVWRRDQRCWRMLPPIAARKVLALARGHKSRLVPVVTLLPDATLAHEGDLCLWVRKYRRQMWDRKAKAVRNVRLADLPPKANQAQAGARPATPVAASAASIEMLAQKWGASLAK